MCRTLMLVAGLSLLPLASANLSSLLLLVLVLVDLSPPLGALSPPFVALSVVLLLPAMVSDVARKVRGAVLKLERGAASTMSYFSLEQIHSSRP